MKVNIYELGKIRDDLLKIAIIVSKYQGKNVYVRHQDRRTYEMPGGHRETDETIAECAERELREETGATEFTIKPLFTIGVDKEGEEDYGQVFEAEIKVFSGKLDYEMVEIIFLEGEPESYTYPWLYVELLKELKR